MNGVHIRTVDDIRLAMQKSPAYCKLEVVDELGETRLVQRAIYEGDPSDLGVILPRPDQSDLLTRFGGGFSLACV